MQSDDPFSPQDNPCPVLERNLTLGMRSFQQVSKLTVDNARKHIFDETLLEEGRYVY